MSLDLYQPCPGGLSKSIKFCCKDLARELESVMRKIDGNQMEAATAELDKHIEQYPDRQCFWALKVSILIEKGDITELGTAIQSFLKVAPQNPVALAGDAILAAATPPEAAGDDEPTPPTPQCRRAVDQLQAALENSAEGIPIQIYDALGVVASRLMAEGLWLGAREHLAFQVLLDRDNAQAPYSKLIQISRNPSISLLLRQDMTVPPGDEGQPWSDAYNAAVEKGSRGLWRAAERELSALADQHPVGAIYRALSVLRCRLAEHENAVISLRQFAAADGVSLDDAIEAEALAQLLDPQSTATETELVEVTQPIKDLDAAMVKIQSDRRPTAVNLDPQAVAAVEGPPPKAGFYLNDKVLVSPDSDDIKVEELPVTLSELLVFGKETDRPARLVFSVTRGERLDQTMDLLRELVGDEMEGEPEERVIGKVPSSAAATMIRTQLPRELPPLKRRELTQKFHEHVLLEIWTKTPLDVLGGKTPIEAAKDESTTRALQAAILILETTAQDNTSDIFDRIRDKLSLERPAAIVPDEDAIRHLPVVRFHRLDASKLSDDDLMTSFAVASQSRYVPALLQLAEEILGREDMSTQVNRAELYGTVAAAVTDIDEALRYTEQAQKAAIKQGHSPARWKISEFSLRLIRGESEQAQAILREIQTRHMKEPGIPQLLQQELAKFGLLRTPGGQAPAAPSGLPPESTVSAGGDSSPSDVAPVITGGDTPEEPQGESKLWLPGME